MGRHLFLYLAPDGLHSYGRDKRSGMIAHGEHYPPEPAGQQAFAQWLEGLARHTTFTILIDLPDERFRIEPLPHVRGRDRKHLRERRQEQVFPDTPFVTHQYLERERSGRRDERILLMALTRPAAISPWLDAIDAAGHAIRRLQPISTLSAVLAQRLPLPAGPALVAQQTPAGLRVSCIDGPRLLFSRLSPAPSTGPDTSAAAELSRVHQYLLGRRTLAHDSPCPSFIIGAATEAPSPAPAPSETDGLKITHIDIRQLARQSGICLPQGDHDSLPLLLSVAAKPLQRLPRCGPASTFRGYRLRCIGNAILGLGVACLCAGLAVAFFEFGELEEVQLRSLQNANRQQRTAAELTRRQAALQSQPQPPDSLQALVEHLSTRQPTAGPEPALQSLARALAPLPAFDIQRIDWSAGPAAGTPSPTAGRVQTLNVELSLPDGAAHLHDRAALSTRIPAALRGMPGAQVVIEHLPAELDPSLALRATELHAAREAPMLGIRIQLPVQP